MIAYRTRLHLPNLYSTLGFLLLGLALAGCDAEPSSEEGIEKVLNACSHGRLQLTESVLNAAEKTVVFERINGKETDWRYLDALDCLRGAKGVNRLLGRLTADNALGNRVYMAILVDIILARPGYGYSPSREHDRIVFHSGPALGSGDAWQRSRLFIPLSEQKEVQEKAIGEFRNAVEQYLAEAQQRRGAGKGGR